MQSFQYDPGVRSIRFSQTGRAVNTVVASTNTHTMDDRHFDMTLFPELQSGHNETNSLFDFTEQFDFGVSKFSEDDMREGLGIEPRKTDLSPTI